MVTRIGINGFGRIGRLVTRAALARQAGQLEIAAVNDLTDAKTNAHLFKYDTNYGVYQGQVEANNGDLVIDGHNVKVFSERDPAQIPWSEMGVDIVIESTGIFTDGEQARGHLKGGASKVIISAPATNVDLTIVLGVNDDSYDPQKHTIVSNASCTTNCFAPMVKVLHDAFGIEKGLMSTIHSYTSDQQLPDFPHKDLRRARSAALSMIPTTTGAATALYEVFPALKGKLDGMAIRVPTPNVSLIDLTVELERDADKDAINQAFRRAADGPLHGIIAYSEEPLVSIDLKGNSHSAIV
ncbi:MAG: type I glyceraldehyde-3-phosphate dehydrogenase, partial [Chloroflexi bacterium]|nr:type I glyceraldehyde-3-phosphate dehydrogenase [Chloroflexota bacterium]